MTQLDLLAGEQAKEAGIQAAEAHADDGWKEDALDAVQALALSCEAFTSSHVWRLIILTDTHEHRAMGSVMRKARALGWIEPTDRFELSVRPSQHRQPLRVWRSLIFTAAPRML